MAERERYGDRQGSSTRSTKARRWYVPTVSRVSEPSKVSQTCSMPPGAGFGLFAIVDIPVCARVCSIILDPLTTLLPSAVSDPAAYTAQQDQNQYENPGSLSLLETTDGNSTHLLAPAAAQTRTWL